MTSIVVLPILADKHELFSLHFWKECVLFVFLIFPSEPECHDCVLVFPCPGKMTGTQARATFSSGQFLTDGIQLCGNRTTIIREMDWTSGNVLLICNSRISPVYWPLKVLTINP